MVTFPHSSLIDDMYDLIGLTRTQELDVIMIMLTTIVILFIFDSILRVFISVLFDGFKR